MLTGQLILECQYVRIEIVLSTCPITKTFNVTFNVIQEHKLQFGLVSLATAPCV